MSAVVCRVAFGHVAGCGFSGRGYAVYRDGVRVTPICVSQDAAWRSYRRA